MSFLLKSRVCRALAPIGLLTASLHPTACGSGNSPGAPGHGDGPPLGGAGGLGGYGGENVPGPDIDREGTGGVVDEGPPLEPLYGEEGDPPDDLRLSFLQIPIAGVNSATDIAFLPPRGNYERLSFLILSRNNYMHLVDLERGEASVRHSWDFDDGGYTSEACAPTNVLLDYQYEETGFVFITKCTDVTTTQLLRFEFDEEEGLSERRVIFETSFDVADQGWHRMGSMDWEDDGVLWMLIGDHEDSLPNPNPQDTSNAMGSLVRIVPNREPDSEGHTYPEGNWIDEADAPSDVHPAIVSYGLRSPWRGTRDNLGRLWIGDVGRGKFEEVNLAIGVGQNFGWSDHEGLCDADCDGLTDPVAFFDRDPQHAYVQEEELAGGSGQRAIWVGQIYENYSVDRYAGLMDGVVPFGDLFAGFVRGISADEAGDITMDIPIGLLFDVTSWKIGPDGYAYAIDLFGNLHVALLDYQ